MKDYLQPAATFAVVAGIFIAMPMAARSDLSIQYEENRYYIEYSTEKPTRIYASKNGTIYMIDPEACGGRWHKKIGVISATSGYSHPGYCTKNNVTVATSFITTIKALKQDWSELSLYRCPSRSLYADTCIGPITKMILSRYSKK